MNSLTAEERRAVLAENRAMIAPGTIAEPTALSASELARAIAAGTITARAGVEAHIARIEAVNPALNAVVQTRYDAARAEADEADRSLRHDRLRGPLHGVPITIKEQFEVAGMSSTLGVAPAARDEHDGPLVARLRAAGAIVLGKTNVPQLLIYNEADNPVYGRTNNPADPERSSGGSSGGEAAIIAAHGSPLGLGSDIGGSLRTPAHACGIASLKPTARRLTNEDARRSGYGSGQLAIVSQPGPMARSVADLTLAMRVLAAPGLDRVDPPIAPLGWREPGGVDVASLRIAYYEDDGFFPAAASVRRAVREAVELLRDCGARVEPFAPPDVATAMRVFFGILSADGGAGPKRRLGDHRVDARIKGLLQIAEMPAALRPLAISLSAALGQRRLSQQIAQIRPATVDGFFALVEELAAYRRAFVAALDFGGFDAIVCPPHALPALTHGSSYFLTTAASYAMLYNLLGMPAGVVPMTHVRDDEQRPPRAGRDLVERSARNVVRGSAGLPVGVQVVARHWREDVALAVMAAIEAQRTSTW
ncbi:MAG TPA: amidase family protein [Candidatus Elarobacter sp.]|jgi:fatty acid amide hydrolase|nr:amidase family protein [Candidatus Elarobacter sp.]